jgi:two-component system NtrC family sensor kinase
MRLTGKFSLAFALVIVAVSIQQAQARLVRETRFFENDMRRDAAFVGELLGRAVARRWAASGEQAARGIVERSDLGARRIKLRWAWFDEPRVQSHLSGPDRVELARGEPIAERIEKQGQGPGALYTYVPVVTPGVRRGGLELTESLDELHAYLATTKHDVIIQAIELVLGLGLGGALLGFVLIGRPMERLVAKTARIGCGDLSGPLALSQQDELGTLARSIDTMCEQLQAARAAAEEQAAARLAAVEQLRHADRLATVGKLAAGVAHELGTPLNVASGRAQLIAASDANAREVRQHANIIVDQTKRMAHIIRQLLDFARRETVTKRCADLSDIADLSVSMLASMAGKVGVTLSRHSGPPQVMVLANEAQLLQALTNLVVNAIQASPKGASVEIDVGQEAAKAPVNRGESVDVYAYLRVTDHGMGMDNDTVHHIFEPFFTTKDVGEGTGLGLSVTHAIIAEHGGWIDVDSNPGAGSRMTIRLPRVFEQAQA